MKCLRDFNSETICFRLGAERHCLILSDTRFGGACPFYKPAKVDYLNKYVFEGIRGTWKRVKGYDGKYWVSDLGEVMNDRKQMLKQNIIRGKASVQFYTYGSEIRVFVAPLVADAFVPGEGKIAFKDGNPLNVRAANIYRAR